MIYFFPEIFQRWFQRTSTGLFFHFLDIHSFVGVCEQWSKVFTSFIFDGVFCIQFFVFVIGKLSRYQYFFFLCSISYIILRIKIFPLNIFWIFLYMRHWFGPKNNFFCNGLTLLIFQSFLIHCSITFSSRCCNSSWYLQQIRFFLRSVSFCLSSSIILFPAYSLYIYFFLLQIIHFIGHGLFFVSFL